MLRSVRPLDPLGRQELIDHSLHRFEDRDRTGVLADKLGFGPGERFGERVPFIRREPRLGDDRLGRRRTFDRDDGGAFDGAGGSRAVIDSLRRRSVRQRASPPRIRPPVPPVAPVTPSQVATVIAVWATPATLSRRSPSVRLGAAATGGGAEGGSAAGGVGSTVAGWAVAGSAGCGVCGFSIAGGVASAGGSGLLASSRPSLWSSSSGWSYPVITGCPGTTNAGTCWMPNCSAAAG